MNESHRKIIEFSERTERVVKVSAHFVDNFVRIFRAIVNQFKLIKNQIWMEKVRVLSVMNWLEKQEKKTQNWFELELK